MESQRRRAPKKVEALAIELQRLLATRTLTRDALLDRLRHFMFRDQHGDVWTVGPQTKTWYLHQHSRWIATAAAPPESLDGPADLHLQESLRASVRRSTRDADDGPGDDRVSDPATFFQRSLDRVVDAYDSGEIDSTTAEAALENLYVVDEAGTAWMPGAHTRGWYTYSGEGWQRAAAALDVAVLERREPTSAAARRAAEERIRLFLHRKESLPERVVPDWEPPTEFPERVHACPRCGALNVGEVTACIVCGRPLPPPVAPISTSAVPPSPAPEASRTPIVAPPSASAPARPAALAGQSPGGIDAPVQRPAASPVDLKRRPGRRWLFIGAASCLLIVCACAALLLALGLMGRLPGLSLLPAAAPQPEQPVDVPLLEAPEQVIPTSGFALEDSFDDPTRTAVPLFGPDAMEFELNEGYGAMVAHDPGVLVATYEAPILSDFEAALTFWAPDPASGGGYGLVFRSDDAFDGLAHYYLLLAWPADGSVSLGRWGPGGYAELQRAPFAPQARIAMVVRAQGSLIEASIDGQALISLEDAAIPETGIFGLAMYTPRDGDVAFFDDFRVRSLLP